MALKFEDEEEKPKKEKAKKKSKLVIADEEPEIKLTPAVVEQSMEHVNFQFDLNNVNKKNLGNLAKNLLMPVVNGEVDAVKTFLKAKAMGMVADSMVEQLKPYVEKEMGGAKSYRTHGIEISITNGQKKWDFSHDKEWNKLKASLKKAEDKVKEREALMKDAFLKMSKKLDVVDEDGVVVPPAKVISYGADVIKTIIPGE